MELPAYRVLSLFSPAVQDIFGMELVAQEFLPVRFQLLYLLPPLLILTLLVTLVGISTQLLLCAYVEPLLLISTANQAKHGMVSVVLTLAFPPAVMLVYISMDLLVNLLIHTS